MTLSGTCLGNQAAFNSDNAFLSIEDLSATPDGVWFACSDHVSNSGGGNTVTCDVSSWTDTSIVFSGFTGTYGRMAGCTDCTVTAGDSLLFKVWNPQSDLGPSGCLVTAGQPGPTTCSSGPDAITSPPSNSSLNDPTTIQTSPVSCGFSEPNGSFPFATGLEGTIEPSTSLVLPQDSSNYLYVGADAGGNPLTNISWNEDLSVVSAYSGNKSISIGQSQSNSASFNANGTTNVAIAGLGLSGYTVIDQYSGSSGSSGTSLTVPFTTNAGDLVVLAVGGEGVGLIQASGGSFSTLVNDTYSECGSDVIASAAIFGGFMTAGTYTGDRTPIVDPPAMRVGVPVGGARPPQTRPG